MQSLNKSRSIKIIAATSFSLLWAIGLFGVMEADLWTSKLIIMSFLPSLSFGLDKFFYGSI
jgi:hypothetical protein